jgi:hypothetical protein
MQNAILQPRLDPVAVDVFGKREDELVIPVGEFVVNALIPGISLAALRPRIVNTRLSRVMSTPSGATPGISASTTMLSFVS